MQEKQPRRAPREDETMVFRVDETARAPQDEPVVYRNMANGYGQAPRNYANNYGRGPTAPTPPSINAYNTDYRKAAQEQNMDQYDALSYEDDALPRKGRSLTGLVVTAVVLTLAILAVMARFLYLYLGW